MSPELFDPGRFGSEDGRPTKQSDCYALGMVILEVLTGRVPFPGYNGVIVMRKVIDGERPERPQGPEATWFTDDLWEMLDQCWSSQPKVRPTVEAVLERLDRGSTAWQPLPPSPNDDVQTDSDDESVFTANHHPGMFLNFVLNFALTCKRSPQRVKQGNRFRCQLTQTPDIVAQRAYEMSFRRTLIQSHIPQRPTPVRFSISSGTCCSPSVTLCSRSGNSTGRR